MAYMSQDRKKAMAPAINAVLKKYNVKATIAVRHHSTLVLNIKSSPIDFIENCIATDANKLCAKKMSDDHIAYIRKEQNISVNPYWFQEHFSDTALAFLTEVFAAMNDGNHNNSDIQSDYFDVGWYVDVNIGTWNKPYSVV